MVKIVIIGIMIVIFFVLVKVEKILIRNAILKENEFFNLKTHFKLSYDDTNLDDYDDEWDEKEFDRRMEKVKKMQERDEQINNNGKDVF